MTTDTTPDAPQGAQRPNKGACQCPPPPSDSPWLTTLNCTCVWGEVASALQQFAYGAMSDDDLIAFAPVLASLVHDAAYRARREALNRRLAEYPGTRTQFASTYQLSRSQLYNLID